MKFRTRLSVESQERKGDMEVDELMEKFVRLYVPESHRDLARQTLRCVVKLAETRTEKRIAEEIRGVDHA